MMCPAGRGRNFFENCSQVHAVEGLQAGRHPVGVVGGDPGPLAGGAVGHSGDMGRGHNRGQLEDGVLGIGRFLSFEVSRTYGLE